MAKSRGEIRIPVDVAKRADKKLEEKYVKGTGISCLVPIYDVRDGRDLSKEFSKTAILNIVEELSNENE